LSGSKSSPPYKIESTLRVILSDIAFPVVGY
jgi:hypothetical protein